MVRFIRALFRGFIGRCPVCGRGRLFQSYYKLHESCSACGAVYEATGNQSTGAMAINLVLTVALGFAGGLLLVLLYPDSVGLGMVVLLGLLVVFHILFYHFARGLWLGLMVMTGDLTGPGD